MEEKKKVYKQLVKCKARCISVPLSIGSTYQSNRWPVWVVHTGILVFLTLSSVGTSVWLDTYYIDGRLVHLYGRVRRTMIKCIIIFKIIQALYHHQPDSLNLNCESFIHHTLYIHKFLMDEHCTVIESEELRCLMVSSMYV